MNRYLTTLTVVCMAAGISVGTAHAQFGGLPKIGGSKSSSRTAVKTGPSDAQRAQFRACEKAGRKGLGKVPTHFSGESEKAVEGVLKRLAEAEEQLEVANGHCGPGIAGMTSADSTMERYEKLKVLIADARTQSEIMKRYVPLKKSVGKSGGLDPAAVKELQDLSAAYTASAEGKDQVRYAKGWANKVERLAKRNDKNKSEAASHHAQAKEDAAMLAKHAGIDGLSTTLDAMKQHARGGNGPIPKELYAKFEEHLKTVEAFNPTAPLYYREELKAHQAYDAWEGGLDKAAPALAELYKGAVVVKGKSKGKKASVTIKAKKDHCYVSFFKYTMPGANEDMEWTKPLKTQQMQRFYLQNLGKDMRGNGFCMTKAASLTYKGKLKFTGTKNQLQWVVLEWPKTELPPTFFGKRIRLWGESCDPIQFQESWTKPIPGTVAHRKPGDIKKWDKVWASGCDVSPETASYKPSAQYGKCTRKVYKAHAGKIDRAAKARDNAKTRGALKAAIRSLDRAKKARASALNSKCEPIKKRIKKAFDKANDVVADTLMGEAYSDHINKAKRKADEKAAQARPVGADGKQDTYRDRDKRIYRMKNYEQYHKDK